MMDAAGRTCPACGQSVSRQRSDTNGLQPGQPDGKEIAPRSQIETHFGTAMAVLFFCLPAGIAAVIYSLRVKERLSADDQSGADKWSGMASKWITW